MTIDKDTGIKNIIKEGGVLSDSPIFHGEIFPFFWNSVNELADPCYFRWKTYY